MFSLSPFPLKREPTVTAWRGTTLGRDITCAISLIMPLRLRGSYATKRHAFSYFSSSPTLDAVAALRLQFRLRISLMLVMMTTIVIAVIFTIAVVIVTVATAIFIVTIIIAVVVIMLG